MYYFVILRPQAHINWQKVRIYSQIINRDEKKIRKKVEKQNQRKKKTYINIREH